MADTVLHRPANRRPTAFDRAPVGWLPWLEPGCGAGIPASDRLFSRAGNAHAAATALAQAVQDSGRAGLAPGERALAAAAVARRLGCFAQTAEQAQAAVQGLKRPREVRVLLEEGLPSPLTGRLGAIVSAAGALSAVPPGLTRREIWRLEEERLDDLEIVDLILAAALMNWTVRLTLGLGEPTPTEL